MPSIARFIRNTPADALRSYFEAVGLPLPEPVNWNGAEAEVVTPLLRAVDAMSEVDRARVLLDADRITAMADEVGQTAVLGVVSDRAVIEALRNGHERALWLFLNNRIAFQRAEEARYSDERRQGRMWDGFIVSPGLHVNDARGSIGALKTAVGKQFGSQDVEIDLFRRTRPTFDDGDSDLVQVTIYRDGAADDFLEFENGSLVRRPRRPVYEAALTYEPATGVVEVVSPDRESRAEIARIFARELLSAEFEGERIKLRRYDLSVLFRTFDFPTDPDDGIESVQVKLLRLMPVESPGERYTLECLRKATRSIWDAAARRFGDSNPLDGGYLITQVRLTIRFHAAPADGSGRTLPVTITMPNGCDLKGKTDRERLVGEKYLRRWGFLCDV
jgi:hypothetical protein